jgi:hypothetical protein
VKKVYILLGSDDYVTREILDVYASRELAQADIDSGKHTLICRCGGEPKREIVEKEVRESPDGIFFIFKGWKFTPPFHCIYCGVQVDYRQWAFSRSCGGCDVSDSHTAKLHLHQWTAGPHELVDPNDSHFMKKDNFVPLEKVQKMQPRNPRKPALPRKPFKPFPPPRPRRTEPPKPGRKPTRPTIG